MHRPLMGSDSAAVDQNFSPISYIIRTLDCKRETYYKFSLNLESSLMFRQVSRKLQAIKHDSIRGA